MIRPIPHVPEPLSSDLYFCLQQVRTACTIHMRRVRQCKAAVGKALFLQVVLMDQPLMRVLRAEPELKGR